MSHIAAWKSILKDVEAVLAPDPVEENPPVLPLFIRGTEPVLSGGAIRDTILGTEPKDYDIFVPDRHFLRELSDVGLIERLSHNLDPNVWAVDEISVSEFTRRDYGPGTIDRVFNVTRLMDHLGADSQGLYPVKTVQLVLLGRHSSVPMHIATFDHAINSSTYSLRSGLFLSPELLKALTEGTIEVDPILDVQHRNVQRVLRVAAKNGLTVLRWNYLTRTYNELTNEDNTLERGST